MNKITLNHLAERIAEATGQPIEQIRTFVTAFFVEASGQLETGKSVKVKGIGTFNPDSFFTPDEALADEVNSPFSFFEPVELEAGVTDEMLDAVESEDSPISEEVPPEEQAAPEEIIEEPEEQTAPAEAIEEPGEQLVPEMPEQIIVPAKEETNAPEKQPEEQLLPPVVVQKSASVWGYIGFLALGIVLGMAIMYFLMPLLSPAQHAVPTQQAVTALSDTIADKEAPAATAADIVTDTVKPGVYFTTMARRHYGDKSFWVYIYEENIALLDSCHPEYVMPGTVVVIPPPEKYGIDASDIASIDSAKQKVIEIYRRFN